MNPVLVKKGHPLNGHVLHTRETGLIEVLCKHGVGHPAPEEYQPEGLWKSWGTHGCDGCCLGPRE